MEDPADLFTLHTGRVHPVTWGNPSPVSLTVFRKSAGFARLAYKATGRKQYQTIKSSFEEDKNTVVRVVLDLCVAAA